MEIKRTFDLIDIYRSRKPDGTAFRQKVKGEWQKLTNSEYVTMSVNFAKGLLELGYRKGDKIAMSANNCFQWNIADMGMAMIGVVSVPIYPTTELSDFLYIFEDAEPKSIIVSDRLIYEKIRLIVERKSSIERIYTFGNAKNAHNWTEILSLGKSSQKGNELLEISSQITPDDLFTLLYTSGTTGTPKGVMLSHRNMVSNALASTSFNDLRPGSKAISFLPMTHVYERMMNYHCQYKSIVVCYAESRGTVRSDMKEIRPHMFTTMPHMLERYYDNMISEIDRNNCFRRHLFYLALNTVISGFSRHRYRKHPLFRLKVNLARKSVLDKCLEPLGGRLKLIVSGDTTLQPRLRQFLETSGVRVVEGYGMTETSPVIAATPMHGDYAVGTSGRPLKGVSVRIADDGEVLCKGPNVMLGYYRDPELTASAIDSEGWFHTGDVGQMIDGEYLKVTGRKKERFKLQGYDRWVSPQTIESEIRESPIIDHAMVYGKDRPYLVAVLSPNFNNIHRELSRQGISAAKREEMIRHPYVRDIVAKAIDKVNRHLSQNEQIRTYSLLPDEWGSSTGEISPTMKLRRKFISQKYKLIIDRMYNGNQSI